MPKAFKRKYKKKSTALTKKRILDIVHKGAMPRSPIYKFVRWNRYYDGINYQVYSQATPAFYALGFQLSDVPGYTEFVDLYDQYCIAKVEVHFYSIGTSTITASSTNYVSNLLTVVDYDDINVPSSINQLLEFSSVKVHTASTNSFKVTFSPRVANETFKTVLTTGYSMGEAGQWLDCSNADIPHFGLKMGVTEAPVAAAVRWNVFTKYYLQFRNSR